MISTYNIIHGTFLSTLWQYAEYSNSKQTYREMSYATNVPKR